MTLVEMSPTFSNHSHTVLALHFHIPMLLSSYSCPSAFHYILFFFFLILNFGISFLSLPDHYTPAICPWTATTECFRDCLGRQESCRVYSLTRQCWKPNDTWIQYYFVRSCRYQFMTYEKLRGAEGRGGGKWGDKQATSSPTCPFLYTVARMQVFTCKHQK